MVDKNILPSSNITPNAIITSPDAPPLYNPDGSLNWALDPSGVATWINPLVNILYRTYTNNTNNLLGNALLSYRILPGLDIRSSFGYTNTQISEFEPLPLASVKPNQQSLVSRQSNFGASSANTWIVEPQAEYKQKIGNGTLDALLGSTFQQNNSAAQNLNASGFSSDLLLKDIASAPNVTIAGSSTTIYKYNAFFGRLNYNLADKYIFDLNARRDGSSQFGENNRFHNFWSVGGAWIFSQESFIHDNAGFLSFGKS